MNPDLNPLLSSDLAMWSLLAGVLLPPVAAAVNQPRWPSWAKFTVTALLAVAAGAMTAHLSGALTGRTWLSSALVVGVFALLTYQMGWKPSGIAPGIERATSPAGQQSPPAGYPLGGRR